MAPRSSARLILLVACRSRHSRASSGSMPRPSSSTRISFLPPYSTVIAMRVAPRVDRVLDQFLDDGGGTLDDFAGGDLIGEIVGKPGDAPHLPPARFLEPDEQDAALETTMMPMISQNWCSGLPSSVGSGTFMPNRPVITVIGPNSAAITASSFETLARRFDTLARCASRMPVTRSWNTIASSAMRDELIVDVAEAVRHLLADQVELPPRQPADDVALRNDDATQRGDVALDGENVAGQRLASGPRSPAFRSRRAALRARRPPAGSDRPWCRRCDAAARPGPSARMWSARAQSSATCAMLRRWPSWMVTRKFGARKKSVSCVSKVCSAAWKLMPCRTM